MMSFEKNKRVESNEESKLSQFRLATVIARSKPQVRCGCTRVPGTVVASETHLSPERANNPLIGSLPPIANFIQCSSALGDS